MLPVATVLHHNSAYPRGGNDGPLWVGRGLSGGVTGGVHGAIGPVTFAFAPSAWYQQNREFTFRPEGTNRVSPLAYSLYIDWPYRHGEEAFWTFDPGQSHIAVGGYGVEAGFTTGNLWLGPGRRNSLLMTAAGPGVPRGFLGTARPLDVRIGTLEGNIFWGQTRESPYFDDEPDNDRNLLAGVALVFQPAPLPGFLRRRLPHLPQPVAGHGSVTRPAAAAVPRRPRQPPHRRTDRQQPARLLVPLGAAGIRLRSVRRVGA